MATEVMENGTATAPVKNRDATEQDGKNVAQAYLNADLILRQIGKEMKHIRQCLKTGTAPDAAVKLLTHVANLQEQFNIMNEAPNGTNIKGGSSRKELMDAIAGRDSGKEITNRIDNTIKSYGLARLKLG